MSSLFHDAGQDPKSYPQNLPAVQCRDCFKVFSKKNQFNRHWRVPIPCQQEGCDKTFRDDKLEVYLNHHSKPQKNIPHLEMTQNAIEAYFEAMKLALRNQIIPHLCTMKGSNTPAIGSASSGNGSGHADGIGQWIPAPSSAPGNEYLAALGVSPSVPAFSQSATASLSTDAGLPSSPVHQLPSQSPFLPNLEQNNLQSAEGSLGIGSYGDGMPGSCHDEWVAYLQAQISTFKVEKYNLNRRTELLQLQISHNLSFDHDLDIKIAVYMDELGKVSHVDSDTAMTSSAEMVNQFFEDSAFGPEE